MELSIVRKKDLKTLKATTLDVLSSLENWQRRRGPFPFRSRGCSKLKDDVESVRALGILASKIGIALFNIWSNSVVAGRRSPTLNISVIDQSRSTEMLCKLCVLLMLVKGSFTIQKIILTSYFKSNNLNFYSSRKVYYYWPGSLFLDQ